MVRAIELDPRPDDGSNRVPEDPHDSAGTAALAEPGSEERRSAARTVSPERDLVVLLSQALRLLGQSGHPVAASRIAGKAWWAARANDDERGAARINGVMHYLAGLPPEDEAT